MNLRHRPSLAATLTLAAGALALVPTLATAAPAGASKEVVSVEPVEGASAEELTAGLFSSGGRTFVIADDGSLQVLRDADYTSANSTRRLRDRVSALSERPRSFDLRDATFGGVTGDFVTPVKRQNPFGACWAFAAAAGAETSILTETATPVTDPAAALDLSEKQLAWFALRPIPADDPNGQGGEGLSTNFDPATDSGRLYDFGANFLSSTMLFSSMTGPLEESVDPILEYHNTADEYDVYDGYAEPSYKGDWSVPDAFRGQASYELEQSFALPSPASWEPIEGSDLMSYVHNEQGVEAIKDQLLAGRPVCIAFCADASMPGELEEHNYLNVDTWAQYTYESPYEGAKGGSPNHAVTIVGYDDGYSRDNFLADHKPDGDGAFIAKNSWGALDGSYGNQYDWGIDGTGYFYLSYYDKGILMQESYDFITEADEQFARDGSEPTIYQSAYLTQEPSATHYDEIASMGNVYEMRDASVLRSVSILTYSFDTSVRFDLYRLYEGAVEPSDGELLWSRDASFEFGGYHRVELDEPIVVEPGERIGVVATVTLPDGRTELSSSIGYSRTLEQILQPDPDLQIWSDTVVNPGESFYGDPSRRVEYSDGSYAYEGYDWTDYGAQIAEEEAVAEDLLAASDFAERLEARDDAYAALAALDVDDPAYEAAEAAYEEAQEAFSQVIDELPDEAEPALYAYDGFPLALTAEAYDPVNPPSGSVEMLRLYNPASGEHLFTADANEAKVLTGERGWSAEGTGWTAPVGSNTAVHRLLNPFTGEHLYTASAAEREALQTAGWRDEGLAFHSDDGHGTPVYRLSNPYVDGVGAHLFTTSAAERDQCVRDGWRSEGIAWYGL